MSGRVSVLLSDGRRVRGYRKTLNVRTKRTSAHLLPPWVLSFELPAEISLRPGFDRGLGLIGLTINADHVEVTGRKDFILKQAQALLLKLNWHRSIMARLTRAAEPGPTLSGPLHAAVDRVVKIDPLAKTVTEDVEGHRWMRQMSLL